MSRQDETSKNPNPRHETPGDHTRRHDVPGHDLGAEEARSPEDNRREDTPRNPEAKRPGATTKYDTPAADSIAPGTTHDPNSVTTGTDVEPTRGVYPPKGEDKDERDK
ncbi:hypothetical protein JSE7799_00086 [Jannaschia seosinensis]|uniref:Uncharacterized protein n=1 Tax=Jannaschia seosinensis TaxID=313367 RepID=A0A0M7B805_9RHOB|nr:hypothetical protein [Jannaschia seosinensis]CUH08958.1 hypothetical protein JSE7799_00086 [Jannaschia seosinensis]